MEFKELRWLLMFARPLSGKIILAITLGTISNLSVVAIPLLATFEVLSFINGREINSPKLLFFLIIFGVIRGVSRYFEQYLNHDIAFRLLAKIREKIFNTIRNLGPAKVTGKHSAELITSITSDVEALEVFFAHTISPVMIACFTTLVTVGFLSFFNLWLAVLLFIGQLIVGVFIPAFSYLHYQTVGTKMHKSTLKLNQGVIENIESISEIVQFQLEEKKLNELRRASCELNHEYRKKLAQGTWLQFLSESVLIITSFFILIISIHMNLSKDTAVIATVLSLSSFGPVLALNGLGNSLLTTMASSRRLFELINESPNVIFQNHSTKINQVESLEIKDLSFSHEQQSIFKNLSFNINKNEIIGVGGESGSGKSTLVRLIQRYWDPDTGTIQVNHQSIQQLSEETLHDSQGIMEQQTFLFESTIEENIRIGRNYSLDEIYAACKKAQIYDWIISLPSGYQTRIGKNSLTPSDGERQRIGLARLFLKRAPVLLLDEPTSNLDYLNEKAILKSVKEIAENRSVLLVSHRPTTLAISNRIIILHEAKGNN